MSLFPAPLKKTLDFADRNKVPVLTAIVVTSAILAGSAFLPSSSAPAPQPVKPASAHASVQQQAPAKAPQPTPSPVHQAPKKVASTSTPKATVPAPTPKSTSPVSTPVQTAPVTPSPTPAPTPSPLKSFNPATDVLSVPAGGSSASVVLYTTDGLSTMWNTFYPEHSFNNGPLQGDKPNAPEYIVFETTQTSLPLTGNSITIHVNATSAATVGITGEVGVVMGDTSTGNQVVEYIKVQVVAP